MVHTVRHNRQRYESNHVPSDENRLVLGGAKYCQTYGLVCGKEYRSERFLPKIRQFGIILSSGEIVSSMQMAHLHIASQRGAAGAIPVTPDQPASAD